MFRDTTNSQKVQHQILNGECIQTYGIIQKAGLRPSSNRRFQVYKKGWQVQRVRTREAEGERAQVGAKSQSIEVLSLGGHFDL